MGRSNLVNATTPASPSAGGHHVNMNSPIPYLFGGLGLMLALIAMALLILACSYRKYSDRSAQNTSDEEKPAKPVILLQPEMEPKINLVIMAGDEKPRYLAMPVSSTNHSHQHLQA
ncbi:hypothetical protein DCAR_0102058 [Daucus carota subsp. sativus]|uniref:Uncharacterized protein n=1 Tax=Daucus carota subsp. sativus TaxID=79200 RepID=A0A166GUK2_DAUCS|nr:PREDICTED: protein GLUTAMINE DUMPER 2-like [Daucus carota subsp. sativus]WOG82888.1 hypothetical protein DCAR_0102058 [Daucus carota subsp. sativus]